MPTQRQRARAVREPKMNVLPKGVVKPNARTLKQVVDYLAHIGLWVYGTNYNLENGDMYLGQRDYTAQGVVAYRRKWHNNTLGKRPVELDEEE